MSVQVNGVACMSVLFILNDPPYGTERVYNGLRLANALAKAGAEVVTVFLMADTVLAAKANQKTPDGHYNLERMLHRHTAGGGQVLLCGSCMDARGLTEVELVEGAKRSSIDELAHATMAADKVLVF